MIWKSRIIKKDWQLHS